MDTPLAIRARGITKCFGDVVALDGIDLDVAQGQIHGLVGPNGAGKTTLLGLLLGLAVAESGRLEILGRPVGRALAAPDDVAGFVAGPGLYPSLTPRQNLPAPAAETRELDYRLLTSDPRAARRLAVDTAGIRVVDDAGTRHNAEVLVVRALVPALDELVVRLVHAGIAVRELAPVVSPLETAFL